MTAMTSEYRLVDVVTSEEQLRFRLTDDSTTTTTPRSSGSPATASGRRRRRLHRDESLYVKTMDGTIDCERVGKPYSQS